MSSNKISSKGHYIYEFTALFVSFLLACGLWYEIVGNDHSESNIPIRVEYTSLPDNYIISEGRIDIINVRVQSSVELLKRLTNRDIPYVVNLEDAKIGVNVLPIQTENILELGGFKVLSANPDYLVLDIDAVRSKTVPVHIEFNASDDEDLHIGNVRITPSTVEVRGASNLLKELDYISVPFDLSKVNQEGNYSRPLQLQLPDYLKSDLSIITISFDLVMDASPVELTRPVIVRVPPKEHLQTALELVAQNKARATKSKNSQESDASNQAISSAFEEDEKISFENENNRKNDLQSIESESVQYIEKMIESEKYITEPRAVILSLEAPQSKIKENTLDLTIASQIIVYTDENDNLVTEEEVPLKVKLPNNVKLLGIEPSFVTIIKK